ncbi:MAG: DUF5666 domain-containing protein [Myxococcota bacterium]
MSARLAFVFGLAFCLSCSGGGSSGGGGTDVASGGIGGTGISSGSVTGFGSFFVTGTAWSLAATGTIEIDGETRGGGGAPFTEADLELGMYLRVDGTRDATGATGSATTVIFDEAIRGAVEQTPVNVMGQTNQREFTVLGQRVVIDEGLTVFEGITFDTLALNRVVEVSGPVETDGTIRATRLEDLGPLVLNATPVEFKGRVDSLGLLDFEIGPTTVQFVCGGTTDCSGLPTMSPSAGALVEVEGIQTQAGMNPEVMATTIRPFVPFSQAVPIGSPAVEVQGVVDDFSSLSSFSVNGLPVSAGSATLEPNTPALFEDGVYVEVEGDVVGGILVAATLRLEDPNAQVAARIATGGLDRLAQNEILLLVEGTPGMEGFSQLIVEVDPSLRLEDDDGGDDDLNLEELMVGDFLEVHGVDVGDGRIRATEIEREDVDDVELTGAIEAVDTDPLGGRGFMLHGVFVELVQGTTRDDDGNVLDVTAFLAGLAVGTELTATDEEDGSETTFDIANEVDLDD